MSLSITIVPIDDVSWTAIRPAIDCYVFVLLPPVDILFRTDDGDPNTEITLFGLQEFDVGRHTKNNRLMVDMIEGYAKAVTGVANVKRICRP